MRRRTTVTCNHDQNTWQRSMGVVKSPLTYSSKFAGAAAHASLMLAATMPHQATADPLDYIQLTCSPELNYFAARTISWDLSIETQNKLGKDKGSDQRIEERDGMHLIPGDIAKHPYACKLPHHAISLEITNYFPGGEHAACGSLDHFDLLVRIDGNEADEFSAFGINRCTKPETHLIEFDGGLLSDCTIPYIGNSSADVSCTILRGWKHPHQKPDSTKPESDSTPNTMKQ